VGARQEENAQDRLSFFAYQKKATIFVVSFVLDGLRGCGIPVPPIATSGGNLGPVAAASALCR
jgi:hypothetical protein